jgi:hypothetical protein
MSLLLEAQHASKCLEIKKKEKKWKSMSVIGYEGFCHGVAA